MGGGVENPLNKRFLKVFSLLMAIVIYLVSPCSIKAETVKELRVKWKPNSVTITFDANGGSGTVPSSQTYYYGTPATLPGQGSLTRDNYDFLGWSDNKSATEAMSGSSATAFGYADSGNTAKTLYAVWKSKEIPVTLMLSNNYAVSQIRTYYSDGTLAHTYNSLALNVPYTAYAGGKVVLTHPSSYSWDCEVAYESGRSSYGLSIDAYCRFIVPKDATGGASLYVDSVYGNSSADSVRLGASSGWVRLVILERGE